ncbi:TPA: hypothetical protein ACPZLH_001524 [Yersinia enterocolitica]
MKNNVYGFYKETYESGHSVSVLQTGDGYTSFNTIYDKEHQYVGIGFSYGNGDGNIGKLVTFNDGTTLADRDCKWLIKFKSSNSIDALIAQLEELKTNISNGYLEIKP